MVDPSVNPAVVEYVFRLVREHCGLVLEPGKEYLIRARLAPLASKHGAANIGELIERLRSGVQTDGLLKDVIEAMVTTETSFFRDFHPFEALRTTVLPQLIEARRAQRELKIWCAASSSGQEPYSLAILLHEHFPELANWRLNFWATDVSNEMLERSRTGRYTQIEVNRGLPTRLLLKWFRQDRAVWEVAPKIRETVTFAPLNLVKSWPMMPQWDLICIRNVMIYFDVEAKREILRRIARVMSKDGYLLLGTAETTLNLHDGFRRIEVLKSGFYQLKD